MTAVLLFGWERLVGTPYAVAMADLEKRLAQGATQTPQHPITHQTPEKRLAHPVDRLVPNDRMAGVMHALLGATHPVHWASFDVKPAEKVLHCERGLSQYGPGTLFRHDVKLRLEGTYPDILNFVHTMEAGPWNIQTDRFALKVVDAPRVTALAHVHLFGFGRSLF